MFDDRIYQMTNGVKAADRIIYTVMLNEQKFYHDKGQYYTPFICSSWSVCWNHKNIRDCMYETT